jgi:hypothetical protein
MILVFERTSDPTRNEIFLHTYAYICSKEMQT